MLIELRFLAVTEANVRPLSALGAIIPMAIDENCSAKDFLDQLRSFACIIVSVNTSIQMFVLCEKLCSL